MMGTWLPETCWATIRIKIKNTKKWHLVGFSYPHWITMHGQPRIRFKEKSVYWCPGAYANRTCAYVRSVTIWNSLFICMVIVFVIWRTNDRVYICLCCITAKLGPWAVSLLRILDHLQTLIRQDSSERVIGPSQRPVQQIQEMNKRRNARKIASNTSPTQRKHNLNNTHAAA